MSTEEKLIKKKKRTKNTTGQQYNIYLDFLNNDFVFRSGIINPTLEDDYLKNKWHELKNLLNSCGDGPSMNVEEWKKRLNDWKYAVRAKARKIMEHKNKTGSGPQIDQKLTDLEERAISLWGKVVVTGTPCINTYDGVPSSTHDNVRGDEINLNMEDIPITEQDENIINNIEFIQSNPSVEEQLQNFESIPQCSNKETPTARITSQTRHRPKPLSVLTENLLSMCNENANNYKNIHSTMTDFCKDYTDYKNKKLKLEAERLKFDIAKYKFENPNFFYE